jgi:hypothetical protein
MMTTQSNFGATLPAQNGMGINGATGQYELGGDLLRPTAINTSAANTLSLTGLQNGDPVSDFTLVVDAAGIIRYLPATAAADFFRSGTAAAPLLPDGTNDLTENVARSGNVGLGISDPSVVAAKLDLTGSQVFRPVALANFAANGAVGPSAATVDVTSHLSFQQTTAGVSVTLPAPTNTQAGRILIAESLPASTVPITVNGQVVQPSTGIPFIWSGTAWIPLGSSSQDFWRTVVGTTLPDGTTDPVDAIRRIGHTGIGGAAVTDAMPTVTTPTAANVFFHLSPAPTGRAQVMYGSDPLIYYMVRTVPTTVNDYVEICSWTSGSQASSFVMSVNVSDGNFAVSKFYVAALDWNATANVWRVLKPLSDGGAFNANNYEILVNVNNGVASFRLRRTSGANAGTARIYLQVYNDPTTVLTELNAVANDPGVYSQFDPFVSGPDFWRSGVGATTLPDGTNDLTENIRRNGNVGINVDPVSSLDVGGAQILRPVIVADLAANGAVGTALATVDITSTLVLSQTTAGISMTLPNPTNPQAGRILYVTHNGTVATIVAGQILNPGYTLEFIWDGNSWNPIPSPASLAWLLLGNTGTTPTAYNDNGAQTNNFAGTLDNQAMRIYTNASHANAKSDLQLYPSTPAALAVGAPVDIFHVRRNGQAGVTYPQVLSVALGHWWTDGSSRTRADFRLGNGNVYVPDFTNLSLFSQGGVGISGSGTSADWSWAATGGGIGRGNGGALLSLMGLNASNNVGPHVAAWTTADTFPLFYQLNWTHDNISMLFDGYFDGAWKAAHTTRPYSIYKTADRLNFYGQAAVPAAAGSAWAQDLIMALRYAGATLPGGELWFNNVVKSRRIVLFDGNPASDHQFYGFGINGATLRYQIDGVGAAHRFYAATGPGTSTNLVDIRGDNIIDSMSALILRPVTLGNFAANAIIGTAAATVDIASTINISQTTAGITLTLPNPTYAQSGRLLKILNTGNVSVTVAGQVIASLRHHPFVWSGAAWIPLAAPTTVLGSIDAHTDVDTTTVAPTSGQSLVWNAATNNWVPGTVTSAPDIQIYSPAASVTIDPLPVANQAGIAPFNVTYTNPSATRSIKLLITFKPGELRVRIPDEVQNLAVRCNCKVGGVTQNIPSDMDRRWSVSNPTGGRIEYTTATRDYVYTMTLAAGANVTLAMDFDYDVNIAPSAGNNGRFLIDPCQIVVEGWLN